MIGIQPTGHHGLPQLCPHQCRSNPSPCLRQLICCCLEQRGELLLHWRGCKLREPLTVLLVLIRTFASTEHTFKPSLNEIAITALPEDFA